MLRNNPSICCEYILLSLVSKNVDWPLTRQNKARWDRQTENAGDKGRRTESERCQPATQEARHDRGQIKP